MLDYDKTRHWQSGDVRQTYTARDTILYALGLGVGRDPLDAAVLRLVYEKNLLAVPTMASVLASPGNWMRERKELGIDFTKLVHGEQTVQMHGILPSAGTVVGRSRVTAIVDKGEGKGAVLYVTKQLFDDATQAPLATIDQVLFLRGNGGFAASAGSNDEAPPAAAAPPDRPADATIDLPIRPEAALVYRLSGDLNPLHIEPEFAAKAGFPKPILHGLATHGMAGWGLVRLFSAGDASRLKSLRARFSSPVFPGETLRIEAWTDGGEIAFRAKVVERDVAVLANGRAVIEGASLGAMGSASASAAEVSS
ncbi:MAG: 3-alpha,7-alpha, 12-alpha-trihydroxy-5-beta-cholest-24-enoyl-CoA hydratase [Rhizobacter sp.]|nr:3-alpha,7-alpha, 12-alpha-trihydroxy-5-beta-cholest-24-enoyl-CoA hydratase [Rhizobacter sp.]